MSIQVAIDHRTEYRFDRSVNLSPHVIRLRPAAHSRTPILGYSLKISPQEHFINWQQDPFGNYLARLVFPEKRGSEASRSIWWPRSSRINPFDFFVEEYAAEFPFAYDRHCARSSGPIWRSARRPAAETGWTASTAHRGDRVLPGDLNQRCTATSATSCAWSRAYRPARRPCDRRKGSCRDTGWLLVQILRHLGLAARFVSGYLVQLTADVKSLDGPSGPEQDFTDLHAWAEVYVPGAGWIGLDPTSGLFAGEGHIPLGLHPGPGECRPDHRGHRRVRGSFSFHNEVPASTRIPRVTKPYTRGAMARDRNLWATGRRRPASRTTCA